MKLTAEGKGENPERYILGNCTVAITICNRDDITQSRTYEMRRGATNLLNREK